MRASGLQRTPAWRARVSELQADLRAVPGTSARLRLAARVLTGSPYLDHPLRGGPAEPERLVVRLDAFDCVTFVETCLALARSGSVAAFRRELVLARYREGRVDWRARLHYFSDWLRWNRRRGALGPTLRGAGARQLRPRLSLLPGLPPRTASLWAWPRRALPALGRRLPPEALVAFASLRRGLDFFHVGLLLADQPGQPAGERSLVHASRGQGGVVSEPLGEFLARNRTRGLTLAAPAEQGAPA